MSSHASLMTASPEPEHPRDQELPRLTRNQRRVLGVLVEKSKTTPDVYPMTVNAIRSGANQKNNRAPKMELSNEDVEDTLLDLRHAGAVVEVVGDGRVPKYRHSLYDWLTLEKKELSVLAELLLRGEQTLGELRSRASRMDPIENLDELKSLLQGLLDRGLVLELTPPGRGQLVTHNFYLAEELEKVKQRIADAEPAEGSVRSSGTGEGAAPPSSGLEQRVAQLEAQVRQLQETLEQLIS